MGRIEEARRQRLGQTGPAEDVHDDSEGGGGGSAGTGDKVCASDLNDEHMISLQACVENHRQS